MVVFLYFLYIAMLFLGGERDRGGVKNKVGPKKVQ